MSSREAPNRAAMGSRKYKAMIDRGTKRDDAKNLPFTFSKRSKELGVSMSIWCPECGHEFRASRHTVYAVCSNCKGGFSVGPENSCE